VALRASIDEGWKMYAPDSPPPTIGVAVRGASPDDSSLTIGALQFAAPQRGHDPNFGTTISYYRDAARLWLPVTRGEGAPRTHTVTGTLQFMVCTDAICLPPAERPFRAVIRDPTAAP
jgi:thiol:disulfide interchange protein DsbD